MSQNDSFKILFAKTNVNHERRAKGKLNVKTKGFSFRGLSDVQIESKGKKIF